MYSKGKAQCEKDNNFLGLCDMTNGAAHRAYLLILLILNLDVDMKCYESLTSGMKKAWC